ncbi:MAG TPA: hypothetical protein VKM54_23165 [Myxococcota bacterium]|nr:hypothetical protein [Myxococcota bacterium]
MAEGSAGVRIPAGTADYERMRQRHVARFEALFAGYCDRIDWSAPLDIAPANNSVVGWRDVSAG